MKKITFRRCTVMAAVFAACLFAAGCKPNQPNPEPAPNPAPNPTPNPAPAPSLEVPMPNEPSVTPGGTIQQETIPNPDPSVETVNVKIEVRSIAIPLTSGLTHGVALSLPANGSAKPAIVTVPVPKAIVDNDLKRSEKMQELLLLMLKTKGLGDCKLYKTGAQTNATTPLDPADASNFLRNGTGKVYVGEPRKTITVTALEDAGLKADGSRGVEFVKIAQVTSSVATNGAEPKRTMSAADIKAITDATLQFTVWNTDTITERRNTVENTVKAFLNGKISGTDQYKLFDTNTPGGTLLNFNPAGAANSLFGSITPPALGLRTAYFAIKELTIPVLVTIKPIAGRVMSTYHATTPTYCEPTNDLSGQYYTSMKADGTTAIKNTMALADIIGGIQKNLENTLVAKGATYNDYVFFKVENPTPGNSTTNNSPHITDIGGTGATAPLTDFTHNMTIYIGKKIN